MLNTIQDTISLPHDWHERFHFLTVSMLSEELAGWLD